MAAATGTSKIDFKSPRQKEWGIIKSNVLTQFNYGGAIDDNGTIMNSYSTNCYQYVLDQAHDLLASGLGIADIQVVEFVPYDYIMQPNV